MGIYEPTFVGLLETEIDAYLWYGDKIWSD